MSAGGWVLAWGMGEGSDKRAGRLRLCFCVAVPWAGKGVRSHGVLRDADGWEWGVRSAPGRLGHEPEGSALPSPPYGRRVLPPIKRCTSRLCCGAAVIPAPSWSTSSVTIAVPQDGLPRSTVYHFLN